MSISQFDAESTLKPYIHIFKEVIDLAWNEYNDLYSVDLRLIHSARTRSSIVHDLMRHHAIRLFDGMPGVYLVIIRGLFLVDIEGKVVVRFKKLRRDRRGSNILTGQTMLFNSQQFDLPGIPARPTGLVAGYQLDDLQLHIDARLITCPDASGVAWHIDVDKSPVESPADNVIEIHPRQPGSKRRVRVKKSVRHRGVIGGDESS